VKIGLLLPQYEPSRWTDILACSQAAESAGFDSVWVEDHLMFRDAGAGLFGPWECWTLLAALAGTTKGVGLGTLVTGVGYRNPALLAKMASTVQEISAGRLTLGLGAGWYEPEYRAFGYPFDHRVGRFSEALVIIRRLLHGERVDFRGAYHTVLDCELRPRVHPIPPIMVGGSGPRVLGLAAANADAVNVWATWAGPNSVVPPEWKRLDDACEGIGRDPATISRSIQVAVETPFVRSTDGVPSDRLLRGSIDDIVDGLSSLFDLGAELVQVQLVPIDMVALEWFVPVVAQLKARLAAARSSGRQTLDGWRS
jgi:alkanesulfonate monooxygenase SsuD/methylene tetrahydromethanopterin reductase-like flavin-dependent oxidoreductase (luciferase family)